MFERLLQMEVEDLRDLLAVVSEDSHAGYGLHEAPALVARIVAQLRTLLRLPEDADRDEVARRVLAEVAAAMDAPLDPADTPATQLDALHEHISARVARELTPLFRVAVSMGWADGAFTPDELQVVRTGLGRLRISEAQRDALCRITEQGKAGTRELIAAVSDAATDPDRRRAMLSFAWAVALADGREDPGEVRLFERLAENLGVPADEAETLRRTVTVRYEEALAWARREVPEHAPEKMAALVASNLDDFLDSATGVIGLSMLLGVPISLHGTATVTAALAPGQRNEASRPGLVAGTLLLRGLRERPALQRSLAVILALLDG